MVKSLLSKYRSFGVITLVRVIRATVVYHFLKDLMKKKNLVADVHDYRLKLDLGDPGISRQLAINGTREQQLRYILEGEVHEGMTILDIGANIGYYPIMEAKLTGESGYVYALEPAPENYKSLVENIRLNGLSHVFETYNMGVSNRKGVERFYLSDHSNLHTFIPKSSDGGYVTKGTTDNYIEVAVTDLSSFLRDKKPVDLIRMDVEGYEVEIFEGLEEAVRSGLFSGKIIFECHFPKYDEGRHSIRKQLEMLFKYGYRVAALTSTNEAKSRVRDFGYKAEKIICTSDDHYQGVYRDVSAADAVRLVCELGGVRDVVLARG
ncbi:MAG: FkbM family methyltransferase [Nitrospirae bacterium]|nr:FkbM family methyltransferase [Nitrospirota bacterium]